MDIEGQYRIAASREQVWAALNDPDVLRECIPGCQSLEPDGDDALKARIKAVVGPVRSTFDTRIRLENVQPPERYTLVGEAKAGAAGFGRGSATVALSEDREAAGVATLLDYRADLKLGGKLAQVGSRLVQGATRKTADEFFRSFSTHLDEHAVRTDEPEAEAGGAGRWIAAAVAVLVVLLLLWFLLG
jgi:carbon monoxide dehydrogenase subunit G